MRKEEAYGEVFIERGKLSEKESEEGGTMKGRGLSVNEEKVSRGALMGVKAG